MQSKQLQLEKSRKSRQFILTNINPCFSSQERSGQLSLDPIHKDSMGPQWDREERCYTPGWIDVRLKLQGINLIDMVAL